jgi:hypothetical protein
MLPNSRLLIGSLQNRFLAAAERLAPGRGLKQCPCCGWTGLYFRTFVAAEYLRAGAICPRCRSLERHRALTYFYPKFFASLTRRSPRVVHFAPEKCLENHLKKLCRRYTTSSYEEDQGADLVLDLTDLALADESCDVLLMNHVLDCMREDRPAVSEMYRVLKPGGAVLAVIHLEPAAKTVELPPVTYGQYRIYGSEDLSERFAPFRTEMVDAAGGIDENVRRRNGIPAHVSLLVLRKPARRKKPSPARPRRSRDSTMPVRKG